MNTIETTGEKLEWSALEYEEKERSVDWFWALGVIVVAGGTTAVIYDNYFFALLLVISGILLGYFAMKPPELVSYELNTKGLKIKNRLFPYENIKSFWVHANLTPELGMKPMLFIKSERVFLPIISLPIEYDIASDIREIFLSKNVEEEEMREHISNKIMETLGF